MSDLTPTPNEMSKEQLFAIYDGELQFRGSNVTLFTMFAPNGLQFETIEQAIDYMISYHANRMAADVAKAARIAEKKAWLQKVKESN